MLSNTITIVPSMDARVVDSRQAFSSSRVSYPTTLPLDTLAFARKTAAHEALVERIAEIIASFRIAGPHDRYEDVYKPKLLETLRVFVTRQEPINLVVPAYPFKSPNREEKVLGPDVDVGERMSLEHFNSIGARIQQIYPPGGHVTIVSDGCCYNDLLGVSDEEVFRYAAGLHRITEKLQLRHLRFSDPFDLIEGPEHVPTTEEEYAQRIGAVKDLLFNSYLPSGYDFDADLKRDNNALLTYRGYIKFLVSDLATLFKERKMSKSAIKKHCSTVARGMIERGKAFAALVGIASPLHVRLSIHASDNTRKLSVALLPDKRYSTFPVTPWHTTPCLDATNASLTLGRRPDVADPETTYTLCRDDLGLAFLRADVPMYRILDSQHIQLEPLYPFGLKITVPPATPISHFQLASVAELARVHSPLVFEGLDPLQYTDEIADDFQRIAGGALSLSLLHEGIGSAGAAASYFVQVGGGDGGAVMPFGEAAAALDDVRYRVLHQWRDGHAVVADHRVALPVHLSPSSLRVLRAGV